MNKLMVLFLKLLTAATLASGQLWAQTEKFVNGQSNLLGVALGIFSAMLLAFALLALGRIVYVTALVHRGRTLQKQEEETYA